MGGFIAIRRKIFDHPAFADEPFTEREAWVWLIASAAWKPTRARVKDTVFTLDRGQCAFSLRFLAEKWKWSKNRVARFLNRLQTDTMIGTQAGRDATLITICNYEKYQSARDADGTQSDPQSGTQTGRRRDKEEQENNRTIEDAAFGATEVPSVAPNTVVKTGEPHDFEKPIHGPPATPEADLFRRGKEVLGSNSGGMVSKLLKSKSGNIPLARSAIEMAATKENPREYIGAVIRKGGADPPNEARRYAW